MAAWVEGEAADTMVAHLQLGVPLELYGPHEYCSIYWYCDYLLSAGHQAHAELRGMRPSPPPARGARGKQGGKGGGAAAPQPPPSQNLKQTAVVRRRCRRQLRAHMLLSWRRPRSTDGVAQYISASPPNLPVCRCWRPSWTG